MRRIFGICLFVFLIFPYIGVFSWIYYQKIVVRKEVKKKLISGLKKEELTILKFSKEDVDKKVEWEHSKEFEYNSQMYDVVHTISTLDSIYYYCWEDSKESLLNNNLEALLVELLEEEDEENKKSKSLVAYFKSLYYEEIIDYHVFFLSNTISYNVEDVIYTSPLISQSGPPPEFI